MLAEIPRNIILADNLQRSVLCAVFGALFVARAAPKKHNGRPTRSDTWEQPYCWKFFSSATRDYLDIQAVGFSAEGAEGGRPIADLSQKTANTHCPLQINTGPYSIHQLTLLKQLTFTNYMRIMRIMALCHYFVLERTNIPSPINRPDQLTYKK